MEPNNIPMLIPVEQDKFFEEIRKIIRAEIKELNLSGLPDTNHFQTPGLVEKPLYKISEICKLFSISRPTIYDWVKHGKLKPVKIRSRVYFLYQDIKQLMQQDP